MSYPQRINLNENENQGVGTLNRQEEGTSTFDNLKSSVQQGAENLKDSVVETFENIKDKVSSATDSSQGTKDSLGENEGKTTTEKVSEWAHEKWDQVTGKDSDQTTGNNDYLSWKDPSVISSTSGAQATTGGGMPQVNQGLSVGTDHPTTSHISSFGRGGPDPLSDLGQRGKVCGTGPAQEPFDTNAGTNEDMII
jgi:uncharacterized protein YjbJ (UPF0337 family)